MLRRKEERKEGKETGREGGIEGRRKKGGGRETGREGRREEHRPASLLKPSHNVTKMLRVQNNAVYYCSKGEPQLALPTSAGK